MKTTAFIQSMNFDMKDVDLFFTLFVKKSTKTNQQKQIPPSLPSPSPSLNSIDELKRSTDNGNAESMYKYAIKLENGDGIAVNKREAARYYKMASDNGNKNAMNEYAAMLNKGDEIAVKEREAVRYFKMAADNGHINAMFNYGFVLARGDGIAVNIH